MHSQMAHEALVAAWRECQGCEAALLEELRAALVLLHSYILIKPLVRLGDHEVCAELTHAFLCLDLSLTVWFQTRFRGSKDLLERFSHQT